MAGRPRRKKNATRKTEKTVTRKRQSVRSKNVEQVDPVAALREHRARMEGLLKEVRSINEVTFRAVRELVEATMDSAQELSEFIADEIEKIDDNLPDDDKTEEG